ncbi:MAG: DNA polymerase I [Phycisphaerae bacterium]|nr:DNA polymerase I [Phycisphaerae bacterium]
MELFDYHAAMATQTTERTFYIIDGYAQFFRAYHAIRTPMSSPVTNEPTHMTYGFVGMLLKLFREYGPGHLAVALDVSSDRGTFRSQLYPEYKANRDAPPSDLKPQVERCLGLMKSMQIPIYGVEGFEADDVIATLVKRVRADHPDVEIRIISKDKDLQQLLDEKTALVDVHKDTVNDVAALDDAFGIRPDQVVDMLALMGDTSDNVPGVPGIGPKTAAQLIAEYDTIDGIFEAIEVQKDLPKSKQAIKGKRLENLLASRETIPLGRELITLRDDCELRDDRENEFSLDATAVDFTSMAVDELVEAMRVLGFNRLRDDMASLLGGSASKAPESAATEASAEDADDGFASLGGLFAETAAVDPSLPVSGDYAIIRTREDLDALVAEVRARGMMAVDTETDGLCAPVVGLAGISIATETGRGAYIPTNSPDPSSHLDEATVLEVLRPLLADPSIGKVGHNLKFDVNVLRGHDAPLAGIVGDTMIESYVIDATRASHSMNALSEHELGRRCVSITEVIGKGKKQIRFSEADLDTAGPYAAEDADVTLQLEERLRPQVDALGLSELYEKTELPLVEVLAELEFNGITVDPDELDRQRERLQGRIDELRQAIIDEAPHPFSPDSPKQLAAALFNKPTDEPPGLGLKPLKKGKTGPSTNVEVLTKMSEDPAIETSIPEHILEYRQLTKLVNTYLVALKEAIQPKTGRIHASFNQVVTATGRLSSSDPNLQNIPIRSDAGREIRKAFVAKPGHVLLAADYSQIELRLLAHLSGDENLIQAFKDGMDIHTAVAAEVMDVAPEDVDGDMRSTAKMINFGIVYGITAFGLARRLGGDVSNQEAADIIEDYKFRFPRITEFLDNCVAQSKGHEDGHVETILGRRRAIPQIHARNPNEKALGERMAINTVVQGSAADLIKLAMLDLHRCLPVEAPGTKMLLQIHDELVFEVPEAEIEPVTRLVIERMEGAMAIDVPLVVDAAHGRDWFAAK